MSDLSQSGVYLLPSGILDSSSSDDDDDKDTQQKPTNKLPPKNGNKTNQEIK